MFVRVCDKALIKRFRACVSRLLSEGTRCLANEQSQWDIRLLAGEGNGALSKSFQRGFTVSFCVFVCSAWHLARTKFVIFFLGFGVIQYLLKFPERCGAGRLPLSRFYPLN